MADAAGNWSKLAGLSRWQWRVLLSAPWVLLQTWLRLRSKGFRNALAAAQRDHQSRLSADAQLSLARDTAYALAVAVKYGPWWPRCLLRSLALGHYLAQQGIAFDLRLGVPAGNAVAAGSPTADFTAHAWVEYRGVVLNDRADIASEFAAFDA